METSYLERNGDSVLTLFLVAATLKEAPKAQIFLYQNGSGDGKYIEHASLNVEEKLEALLHEQPRSCLCHSYLTHIVQSRRK